MDKGNSWTKIEVDAIDTIKTPLSGPQASIVYLKVVQVVAEEKLASVKQAVRVQLRDGKHGFVRVVYAERYYESMTLAFHPEEGIEVVQN